MLPLLSVLPREVFEVHFSQRLYLGDQQGSELFLCVCYLVHSSCFQYCHCYDAQVRVDIVYMDRKDRQLSIVGLLWLVNRSTALFVGFMIMYCPDWLSHPVISSVSPVVISLCLSYIIISIFIEVFVITVDTVMLCYCEDMKKNGADGEAEGVIGKKETKGVSETAETAPTVVDEAATSDNMPPPPPPEPSSS